MKTTQLTGIDFIDLMYMFNSLSPRSKTQLDLRNPDGATGDASWLIARSGN